MISNQFKKKNRENNSWKLNKLNQASFVDRWKWKISTLFLQKSSDIFESTLNLNLSVPYFEQTLSIMVLIETILVVNVVEYSMSEKNVEKNKIRIILLRIIYNLGEFSRFFLKFSNETNKHTLRGVIAMWQISTFFRRDLWKKKMWKFNFLLFIFY